MVNPEPAAPFDLGRPQNGRPFDAAKRQAVLEWIAKGASLRQAAALTRVSRRTVCDWLRRGRSDEGRPEHKAFAEAFELARSQGVGELLTDLRTHSKIDPKATIALLGAFDDRFGAAERRLKVEALRLENERLRFERDKAAFEARFVDLKAAALERLLAVSGTADRVGMAALFGDENVGLDVLTRLEPIANLLSFARDTLVGMGWDPEDDELEDRARDIVGRLVTGPEKAPPSATNQAEE